MVHQVIHIPSGQFNSHYEPEKKRVNIVIDSCLNELELLNSIKAHVLTLGLKEAYLSPHGQPMLQGIAPDYEINSYESEADYQKVDGYELIELNDYLYDIYIQITNAATFDIDNMSYVDMEEVLEYVEEEFTEIGLIEFQETFIGTYVTSGSEIESFAIDPRYQGKGHGKKAFQTVLSTLSGDKLLFVASTNTRAIQMYEKLGFQKTDRFVSYWYHIQY